MLVCMLDFRVEILPQVVDEILRVGGNPIICRLKDMKVIDNAKQLHKGRGLPARNPVPQRPPSAPQPPR